MKKLISKGILLICAVCFFALSSVCLASFDERMSPEQAIITEETAQVVPIELNGLKISNGVLLDSTTYIDPLVFVENIGIKAVVNFLQVPDEHNIQTKYGYEIKMEGLTLTAFVDDNYYSLNDTYIYVEEGVKLYKNEIYLPIRPLVDYFNVHLIWSGETSAVTLSSDGIKIIAPSAKSYNEDDLYWLSRLINAEAGNQPLKGKIAVGNVVLNRKNCPDQPDTIYGVVFDRTYGVQFSVTENGTIYNEPNYEAVIAAKMCLDGVVTAPDAMFFLNPEISSSTWFDATRTFIAAIGEHTFYA